VVVACCRGWRAAHPDPNFDPNPGALRRPQAYVKGRLTWFLISKRTPANGHGQIRGICKTAIPGSIPGVASSRFEIKMVANGLVGSALT
jgi:hypothetical protein